ncbi:MAG: hypothetical protein KKA64_03955, partial [Nanoarchaeota archaeon]|nr:hypothetical protein [Nanoarchaeota archaeon]
RIEQTLRGWLNQQETITGEKLDLNQIELLVLINRPNKSKVFDRTKEVVNDLKNKEDFTGLNIHVVEKTFNFSDKDETIEKNIKVPKGARMGLIYKYGADLAVLRNLTRNDQLRKANHLVRTGGADVVSRNPEFLSRVITWFDSNPYLEQYVSRADYPHQIYEKIPLLHVAQRLNEMMNLQLTRGKSHIGLGTYRMGIYAESGGFDPGIQIAEEMDLSKRIRKKMEETTGVDKARRRDSLINAIDNPRRIIATLYEGKSINRQYDDFVNEKIRKIDLQNILQSPVPEVAQLSRENLKTQAEAIANLFFSIRYNTSQDLKTAFGETVSDLKNSFLALGIDKYSISYSGDIEKDILNNKKGSIQIEIKDILTLEKLIKEYAGKPREEWLNQLNKNNN